MGKGGQVCGDICLCFLAILLPPLAVLIKRGCGKHFWLNLLLTLLLWLPGVIHAWYVILTMPPNPKMYGIPEQGTGYKGVMGIPPQKAYGQAGYAAPGLYGQPGYGQPGYQGQYGQPGYVAPAQYGQPGVAPATAAAATGATTAAYGYGTQQPYGYGGQVPAQGYVADRFYRGNVMGAQAAPVGVPDPAFQKPKGMTW